MNSFPSKAIIEARKARYTPGSRVELISMDDPYTNLKPRDRGFVTGVDDIGTVFVNWDNGSSLGAAYGDQILLAAYVSDELLAEIKAVQMSGETNMFDAKAVFGIALREGYDLLADFVSTDAKRYSTFILTGNRDCE